MFWGFPFPTEGQIRMEERRLERERQRRMPEAQPFDIAKTFWRKELNLMAATWIDYRLAHLPSIHGLPHSLKEHEGKYLRSPSGKYVYCHNTLPAGQTLWTKYGGKRGDVMFDGPIEIPGLWQTWSSDPMRTDPHPWMSITPHEILSLRCGERFAKGHTVIAGLGLGWQLVRASWRKPVKQLTLVEREQELVDWLLPMIRPKMRQDVPLNVIVGNAYEEVPKITAEAALIDIYPDYGGNVFEYCPNIRKVWVWGSSY